MRNRKLKIQLGFELEVERSQKVIPPTPNFPRSAAPPTLNNAAPTERSIYDISFEEYKAANLDIKQQHDLIRQIRNEVPLIDRDDIDGYMLAEAARQLETCIFPMCKMMHIEPKAVKNMLDEQFRKAYGQDVERQVAQDMVPTIASEVASDANANVDDAFTAGADIGENSSKARAAKAGTAAALAKEPAKKRAKRTSLSEAQKQVNAYKAKKKRGRKNCRIVTFRSNAAVKKMGRTLRGSMRKYVYYHQGLFRSECRSHRTIVRH